MVVVVKPDGLFIGIFSDHFTAQKSIRLSYLEVGPVKYIGLQSNVHVYEAPDNERFGVYEVSVVSDPKPLQIVSDL